MRPTFAAAAATLILLAPPLAGAQSLSDRLGDIRFPQITIAMTPSVVTVDGVHATLNATTASDVRKCIDRSNCPDRLVEQASTGNGNGIVEAGEVRSFESSILLALNLASDDVAQFKAIARQLVTIDGGKAKTLKVARLHIDGAEGPISSNLPVTIDVQIIGEFPDTPKASRHAVSILRTEASLEVANKFVIQAGDGWHIVEDSIRPQGLQPRFGDGRIEGSQTQLQGTEPLTFQLAQSTGAATWLWIGSLLLLAGGIAAFVVARRRRKA